MRQELLSMLKEKTGAIASVAGWLWQRGWAERNAGNISVRLDDGQQVSSRDQSRTPALALQKRFPTLAGTLFLVTGTNTRMRAVAALPRENMLLIRINDEGDGYNILSPDEATTLRPTSELATHLCIHEMLSAKRPDHFVVMHTHVTELIAMTQIRDFCDEEKLNRTLLGMHPETRVFIPAGIGFVPYSLPGTIAIGEATVKALGNHTVALWEKHGVFATGSEPEETFDIIDLLAKSASIWFLCRSAGYDPEGLSASQLDELSGLKF
jgi:rhamnulose-1-phosphate aldolase